MCKLLPFKAYDLWIYNNREISKQLLAQCSYVKNRQGKKKPGKPGEVKFF